MWRLEKWAPSTVHRQGGGDGKRGTPREIRQNDGSGKESLKGFTKEFNERQEKEKAFVIEWVLFISGTRQDEPGESMDCLHAVMFIQSSGCIQVKHKQI